MEKNPCDSVAKHTAKLEKLWIELQDKIWEEDKVKLSDSLLINRVLNSEYNELIMLESHGRSTTRIAGPPPRIKIFSFFEKKKFPLNILNYAAKEISLVYRRHSSRNCFVLLPVIL